MDDAPGVGLFESLGDLLRDTEGFFKGDRPSVESLLDVLTLDQLEDEEGLNVGLLQPVDRADVRVVQRGEELRLAAKAAESLFILGHLGGQNLDRHVAPEVRVGGAVDLPHPPGPEPVGDPVVKERLADHAGIDSRLWTT